MSVRERDGILVSIVKEYYARTELLLPEDFRLREFAMQPFGSTTYVRHLSFNSLSELKRVVLERVPKHLYVSSARYRDPSYPDMAMKGWLGSDLVFDIDADHLPQCEEMVKEYRICKRCGEIADTNSDSCPRCGSKDFIELSYIPFKCVDNAKEELLKLLDALENELGFREWRIAFSGHRGFHVVVPLRGSDALIDGEMRRELVSYLKLEGVDVGSMLPVERKRRGRSIITLPPHLRSFGYRRRVAQQLVSLLSDECKPILELKLSEYERLRKCAEEIGSVIHEAVRRAAIYVDEKVTMDISRLIRIPKSINGKSGWLCIPLSVNEVQDFEISEETVSPIPNHELVVKLVVSIPRMDIAGFVVEGVKGEVLKLPSSVALYLAFKELAKVINVKR